MDTEELEELFPPPFEIKVSCDWEEWKSMAGSEITELRESLNEKYGYDIDSFRIHVNYSDFEGVEFDCYNEIGFLIKIGDRQIISGAVQNEKLSDIKKIIEMVARGHYQEIIDVDEENWRRMEMCEEEGNYKLLNELCADRELENKRFYYAKKWAEVDNRGLRNLRRCYNRRKDYAMSKKISTKIRNLTDKESLNFFLAIFILSCLFPYILY